MRTSRNGYRNAHGVSCKVETPREVQPRILQHKNGGQVSTAACLRKWAGRDLEAFAGAPATSKNIGHRKTDPPPSHKLHLGSPRGGDVTRSLRERADRRTGTSLPSSARVRQATCPSNVLPYLVTRIGPGLPASLSSQPKQSLLTGREVRDAQRRRPLCLKGTRV